MGSIIVIAASEGALTPLREIVAVLPKECNASVFIVWHTGSRQSILPSILSRASELPAKFAEHFEGIRPGQIYVAPPDWHARLAWGCIWLDRGPKVHRSRPAADPLFESAAEAYGPRVTGIVLSGGDSDGAIGLKAVSDHGGTAFVQRPDQAIKPSMPQAAIIADHPAALSIKEIAARVYATVIADGFSASYPG
jgi:two-component system chemotaxis response regulator CheB